MAVHVLCQVLDRKRKLSEAFRSTSGCFSKPRDRALYKALCFGVLRWLPRFDFLYHRLCTHRHARGDLALRCTFHIGVYQIEHMHIPDHAAVDTSVQVCHERGEPRAAKLINALLRHYLREQETMRQTVARNETAQFAHPRWWLSALRTAWPDDWQLIVAENNGHPPLHLRVNPLHHSRESFLRLLAASGHQAHPCPYASTAVCIKSPLPVTEIPGYAEGYFAVQDASAQLAAKLLTIGPRQRMLDACAAPGGKTGLFLEQWPDMGSLTAIDQRSNEIARLRETLKRLGHLSSSGKSGLSPDTSRRFIHILCGDLAQPESWWDGQLFDAILLDAPCSGSGTIRRRPDIKVLRTRRHIDTLVDTQKRLLNVCWKLLTPGGQLLYATCSLLPEENTLQIQGFLHRQSDCMIDPIEAQWGRDTGFGRQLITGHCGMDGFFYCRMRKTQPDRLSPPPASRPQCTV